MYPEDRPSVLKQVMRIKNPARAHDTEFEFRIVRKDEKIRWIKELYQKIPGRYGEPDNTREQFTILPKKKRQKIQKHPDNRQNESANL
ncbi:MAG: PAS domain-containing protein [Methanosarcina flavescens]